MKDERKPLDLRDYTTPDGHSVFKQVTIDAETGDLVEVELTQEIQEQLEDKAQEAAAEIDNASTERVLKAVKMVQDMTDKKRGAVRNVIDNLLSEDTRKQLEAARPVIAAVDELAELAPYIEEELKKPEYNGQTLEELLDTLLPRDLLNLPEDGTLYKAMKAARAAKRKADNLKKLQQEGRRTRQAMKASAKESGAIMEIKGGNLTFFSSQNLWDSFAPGRISRMGTLDKRYIDENTGLVKKFSFEPGEIEELEPGDISVKAFSLLSAITKNTVDNIYEEFVKGGSITFYVKGVLEKFTDDPRTLYDEQLNLDRKTAGVLYLEKLLEPLQGYIGTTGDGSRYSVFNYVGYDAATDTMTIQTPYLYQLWQSTQAAYFERQEHLAIARSNNRKPAADDFTPLEVNNLFKGKAYTANEITLEIAVYITNVLLTAGGAPGKQKKATIAYKTIIDNCPRFKAKLAEIEARPAIEILEDGTTKNNASTYNAELKKIKSAFDLILDPERCDATRLYNFTKIEPAKKKKNGSIQVIAPTKSKLADKLVIEWQRKAADQAL